MAIEYLCKKNSQIKVSCEDGLSIFAYRDSFGFNLVFDFFIGDLWLLIFEGELWTVECLDGSKCLVFNGLELEKVG